MAVVIFLMAWESSTTRDICLIRLQEFKISSFTAYEP